MPPPGAAFAPPAPVAQEPGLTLQAVTPLLAAVPCSLLTASVDGQSLRVSGYVSERFGLKKLKDRLGAVPGVKSLNLDAILEPVKS